MGWGVLEAVQEEDVSSLEEARRALTELRERNKSQSHLLVAWKRRLKQQNMMLLQLQRERDDHLKNIQSQLMLFESQLRRRQKEVATILQEKDSTIRQQQQIILSLSRALNSKARQTSETDKKAKRQNCNSTEDNKNASDRNGVGGDNEDSHGGEEKPSMTKGDQESLNDSDSAIMLEENLDSLILIPLGKGEVKVVRSVSDAVEVANRSSSAASPPVPAASSALPPPPGPEGSLLKPSFTSSASGGSLSTSPSCSSEESDDSPVCTLTKGRMELLRTVYSMDEEEISHARPGHDLILEDASLAPLSDPVTPSLHSILKSTSHYDSDATLSDGESDDDDDDEDSYSHHDDDSCSDRKRLLGSYEKLNTLVVAPVKPKPEDEIQVTYNRVMSNHRSVTKPKDVKYRRINKAKSRSLEELRGKLKYWTDRGGKQSLSVDLDNHSYA